MALIPAEASARPFRPLPVDLLREMARINRVDVTNMFMAAGNGHFGSCFSCAEILTALYFSVLRVDAGDPRWPGRDRFVMSKGHAAPALYSALIRRGFMPDAWIHEYETDVGVELMTHPSRRYQAGVDASSGALGHGLSLGVGMALAGRMDARDYRVYVLLGDGELHEGSVWEAAAGAGKFQLDQLVAVIDANGFCVDGATDEVLPMGPLPALWQTVGWETLEVDGHDLPALLTALDIPRGARGGKPRAVIARTVKGRGVSFMENVRGWHADNITREQYQQVLAELGEAPG
jgi:transketolase